MALEYLIVCAVALIASGLTLYSGFGLGTLLLPAFLLVFPPGLAVAATAIVHLLNNVFKLWLVGRHADRKAVVAFGVPALVGAALGAWLLTWLADLAPLSFHLASWTRPITPVKLTLGLLIFVFALIELAAIERRSRINRSGLVFGGMLSGFFGGLSGHQGALRSLFLVQSGLSKEAFIGTGVACAVLVDLARLAVYGSTMARGPLPAFDGVEGYGLVIAATLAAFAGAFLGVRLVGKVTLTGLRRLVGGLLIALALAMCVGAI